MQADKQALLHNVHIMVATLRDRMERESLIQMAQTSGHQGCTAFTSDVTDYITQLCEGKRLSSGQRKQLLDYARIYPSLSDAAGAMLALASMSPEELEQEYGGMPFPAELAVAMAHAVDPIPATV